MSAYLCSSYQIGRLAAYLANAREDAGRVHYFAESINATMEGTGLAMAIATVLAEANAESVTTRYPDTAGDGFETWGYGSLGEFVEDCEAQASKPWKDDFKPHAMIHGADNFSYQACEYEGWHSSDAATLLQMIKDRAVTNLLKSLNLNEGWGLEEKDATPFAGILLSDLVR